MNTRQKVWLAEYLRIWNPTEAAYRAGYSKPLRSGHHNLHVLAPIIKLHMEVKIMSAEEALVRLSEQARAAYADYLMEDGTVDLAGMKKDGKLHLVKGIKPTAHGNQVEFYDSQTALVHIGRHHKLFTDKMETQEDVVIHVSYAEDIREGG